MMMPIPPNRFCLSSDRRSDPAGDVRQLASVSRYEAALDTSVPRPTQAAGKVHDALRTIFLGQQELRLEQERHRWTFPRLDDRDMPSGRLRIDAPVFFTKIHFTILSQ